MSEDFESEHTEPFFPDYSHEAYCIDVDEATEILGLSRTRLSQLTTKGILSHERRRIGVRSRHFYRRGELAQYLESLKIALRTPAHQNIFLQQSNRIGASSEPQKQILAQPTGPELPHLMRIYPWENEIRTQNRKSSDLIEKLGLPLEVPKLTSQEVIQKQFAEQNVEQLREKIDTLEQHMNQQDCKLNTLMQNIQRMELGQFNLLQSNKLNVQQILSQSNSSKFSKNNELSELQLQLQTLVQSQSTKIPSKKMKPKVGRGWSRTKYSE